VTQIDQWTNCLTARVDRGVHVEHDLTDKVSRSFCAAAAMETTELLLLPHICSEAQHFGTSHRDVKNSFLVNMPNN